MELVKHVYTLTSALPKHEQFGLASQMQRAAVGIPSNIAEGYMRSHQKEFIQFLSVALGSAAELETQIIVYEYVYQSDANKLTQVKEVNTEVNRMLIALIKKVRAET
jgi:four helix bundle protein